MQNSIISGVLSPMANGFTATGASKDSPEKIKQSATQFESLMIGQLLKSTHEEGEGWLGTGEDETSGTAMGMADDYFARALAARGGLGLAQMVSKSLEKRGA
jgi:Rod binding domain-containing protein